ncbi:MAG TPA: ISAzo13 family transposase [bacterium]|nr:ISAzo13 family transposase [bacterium]
MTNLKWSRKSMRSISEELKNKNIEICPNTVGALLKDKGYSLKVNRKTIAETQHPDRNLQFEIISEKKKEFIKKGEPIICVDSKKKELIGNFKNHGQTWRRESDNVLNHDFRSCATGIANPYGIYDYIANKGMIVIGTSYDTPEFAVESIELWLNSYGLKQYPRIKKLLILCDAGGSNGYRSRVWKYELYQKICQVYGITIQVCHYPSGASKWNPADHRLFSFISMNWVGISLRSYDIMMNYIENTKTKQGLTVQAILQNKIYEKGIKIDDSNMSNINIKNYNYLPQWNYKISN